MFNLIIRNKIKNDPFYRFKNLEEVKIASQLGIKIDVNLAGIDDWLRLPGISIHQAKYLVDLVKIGVKILSMDDLAAALNVPVTRIKPWECILSFYYYDATSLLSPVKINLNTADISELTSIPIIHQELAQKIVEDKRINGNYTDLINLKNRLNLTTDCIAELLPYCCF